MKKLRGERYSEQQAVACECMSQQPVEVAAEEFQNSRSLATRLEQWGRQGVDVASSQARDGAIDSALEALGDLAKLLGRIGATLSRGVSSVRIIVAIALDPVEANQVSSAFEARILETQDAMEEVQLVLSEVADDLARHWRGGAIHHPGSYYQARLSEAQKKIVHGLDMAQSHAAAMKIERDYGSMACAAAAAQTQRNLEAIAQPFLGVRLSEQMISSLPEDQVRWRERAPRRAPVLRRARRVGPSGSPTRTLAAPQ
jgi:hypothetical protein